ncbi:MAG TPA: hypothetical protein VMT86_08295 [Bryobacteraceae bacterium]|nr:hypothetical protein [Bryobacteraceae bacterium]
MHRTTLCLVFMASAGVLRAQVDVLTANYDNNRTNANLNESILNTNNVNPTQFGKLYTFPVDGEVYAQPLYVHALNMAGKGTRNVLYVATMHNSVYAFDADATTGTAPLWHVNLGSSIDPASFSIAGAEPYSDILNEIGILGTPAIDKTGGVLYVVDETLVNGSMAFYLHALDITDGSEKMNGPVQIQGAVEGSGWGGSGDSVNGMVQFIAADHLQRPGLLLANGTVYISFGSHGDYAPWHGWIVAYSAADLQQQTAIFNTTPSAAGSAIWQGGRGLAADADGSVYCSTGNGNYDGVVSWGETVLRLTSTLDIADWFTPSEYADWTDDDLDYGSNGPILIPGTNLLIAGGKAGLVALVDRTNLGHQASDSDAVQVFQGTSPVKFAIFNAALWGLPGGPILYLWAFHDSLREYQMQNGTFNTTPLAMNSTALNGLPFSGMAVSSNGSVPGSGIFWATAVASANLPSPGSLHAFNALDVSEELWNSDMEGARDAMGNFTKFANPTVANGKVYVPTDSGQVVVYGLLPVPGIVAVENAASFSSYTVAPGELITIFGYSIGPATPIGAVLDGQGKISTSLAGHTVTFDGVAAPLLYASAGQINAVVPFSVAGKSSTLMRVYDASGSSYAVTLPVSTTAPATFTIGASGQGAILNQDLSVNSASNPAARGSWISIYATGAGVLTPPVEDGTLVADGQLPQAVAPVTVTIGGLAATVNYQGGAPGLVAGVMQINAQVPSGVAPGSAVPVTISAGGTAGLNTVTVAVK